MHTINTRQRIPQKHKVLGWIIQASKKFSELSDLKLGFSASCKVISFCELSRPDAPWTNTEKVRQILHEFKAFFPLNS